MILTYRYRLLPSKRQHAALVACPHCGLVIDRDWNASLNILRAGIGPRLGNVGR